MSNRGPGSVQDAGSGAQHDAHTPEPGAGGPVRLVTEGRRPYVFFSASLRMYAPKRSFS